MWVYWKCPSILFPQQNHVWLYLFLVDQDDQTNYLEKIYLVETVFLFPERIHFAASVARGILLTQNGTYTVQNIIHRIKYEDFVDLRFKKKYYA